MALALGLLGLILLIPARPIPELFALSKAYASATDVAEKNQLLKIETVDGEMVKRSFQGYRAGRKEAVPRTASFCDSRYDPGALPQKFVRTNRPTLPQPTVWASVQPLKNIHS